MTTSEETSGFEPKFLRDHFAPKLSQLGRTRLRRGRYRMSLHMVEIKRSDGHEVCFVYFEIISDPKIKAVHFWGSII